MSLQPLVKDEQFVSDEASSRKPLLKLVKREGSQVSSDHSKLGKLVEHIGLSLLDFWMPMSAYKVRKSNEQGSDYGHSHTVDEIDRYMKPISLLEYTQHKEIQRLPCREEPRYYELLKHILYRLPESIKVQHIMHTNKDKEGRNLDAIGSIPFIVDDNALENIVVQAASEHCGKYCPHRMYCYLMTDYVPEFHNPDGTKLDSSVFFG